MASSKATSTSTPSEVLFRSSDRPRPFGLWLVERSFGHSRTGQRSIEPGQLCYTSYTNYRGSSRLDGLGRRLSHRRRSTEIDGRYITPGGVWAGSGVRSSTGTLFSFNVRGIWLKVTPLCLLCVASLSSGSSAPVRVQCLCVRHLGSLRSHRQTNC